MKQETGELWTHPAEWKCVTTNGIVKKDDCLVMGGGIALEAAQRHPDLPAKLGNLVKIFGNLPFFIHEYKIISFPTKHHFKDPSDLDLIAQSARHIKTFADIWEVQSIVMPRVGTGLGKLLWADVEAIIAPIFNDDRFIIVSNAER